MGSGSTGARFALVILGGGTLCFLLPWVALGYAGISSSRMLFVAGALLGILLTLLPVLLPPRAHRHGASALAVLIAGTLALGYAPDRHSSPDSVALVRDVQTGFYTARLKRHRELIPVPRIYLGAGGAIETFEHGFVVVTSDGDFYLLSWGSAPDSLTSQPLHWKNPYDPDEFLKVGERLPGATFRITDLLLDEGSSSRRMYLAYNVWSAERRCISLRVSAVEIILSDSGPELSGEWEPLFDSVPCLKLRPTLPRLNTEESGGRLALHPDGVLLTVGDVSVDGLDGESPFAQQPEVSYGKILLLDLAGGSRTFSLGHRNPQGLTAGADGRIWASEHGPEGGDELNIVIDGGNYGWPFVTYGTDYDQDHWPLAPDALNHGQYKEPVFAFVPSIGISQLIELGGEHFPRWSGSLLVASLRARALFRIAKRQDHVVYVEPIPIGARIRDLAQGKDGRIVLWTDAGEVISLTRRPWESGTGESLYSNRCADCHEPYGDLGAAGPPLRGVVGRPVASAEGYPYSDEMQKLGGVWTQERLDEFLVDPQGFVPGTWMSRGAVEGVGQRRALIRFLADYR